jgi:hypothetical protein
MDGPNAVQTARTHDFVIFPLIANWIVVFAGHVSADHRVAQPRRLWNAAAKRAESGVVHNFGGADEVDREPKVVEFESQSHAVVTPHGADGMQRPSPAAQHDPT